MVIDRDYNLINQLSTCGKDCKKPQKLYLKGVESDFDATSDFDAESDINAESDFDAESKIGVRNVDQGKSSDTKSQQ